MINLNNYKIDIKIDLFNNEKINYRNYWFKEIPK
jgi:hypothetical protein